MKLLVVEDNEDEIAVFEAELRKIPEIKATFARSRDSALEAVRTETFELIVLDLRIPTVDHSLDSDRRHGLAVHGFVREHAKGTPVVIFSAYGTLRLVSELAEKAERYDIWGSGQSQPITLFKEKTEFVDCLGLIRETAGQLSILSNIEISSGLEALHLDRNQETILRVFARLHRGANARVGQLGGGLSSARTFRIAIQDEYGVTSSYAAAKLGPITDLESECERYEKYVSPVLAVGGFAPVIKFLKAGAAGLGGLFYSLAKEYDSTLLDVLKKQPDLGVQVVGSLRKLEEPWQIGAPIQKLPLSQIRASFIDGRVIGGFAPRLGFDWQQFEKTEVRVRWCTQHRDFHALNILVKNQVDPLLIDYGEVEKAPASLDPLALELSFLFHPECKKICGAWPTLDQARQWGDVDTFVANSPFPSFLRECRRWASEVEAGDKGLNATAYSYAVRQLKYPDTNHDLAIVIAQAAHARLTAA